LKSNLQKQLTQQKIKPSTLVQKYKGAKQTTKCQKEIAMGSPITLNPKQPKP
jgi:hypothetical protein